mgnify:FL=1
MAKLPGSPHGHVDLTKGSLPILVAIALLCFVASAAYGVGSFISTLLADKAQSVEKFANIGHELKAIRTLIENDNFVRRVEFDSWCRNTEIINKGFKCGNTK